MDSSLFTFHFHYPISRCRDSMRRLTPEFVLMSSARTSRLLSMAFTSSALAKRMVRVRLPLPSSLAKVARMRPFICCTSLSNTSFSTTTSTFGKSRSLGCMFSFCLLTPSFAEACGCTSSSIATANHLQRIVCLPWCR